MGGKIGTWVDRVLCITHLPLALCHKCIIAVLAHMQCCIDAVL